MLQVLSLLLLTAVCAAAVDQRSMMRRDNGDGTGGGNGGGVGAATGDKDQIPGGNQAGGGGGGGGTTGDGDGEGKGMGEQEEKEEEEEEKYEEEKGEPCTDVDVEGLTGTCGGAYKFDLKCIKPKDEALYFSHEFEEDEKDEVGDKDYFYYLAFNGLPEEPFGYCTLGEDEKSGNSVVQASKNGHHCYVLGPKTSATWSYNDETVGLELLVVTYKTAEKFVEVHIFCDRSADEPIYSVRGEEEEWENHYDLELRTKWVCKEFAGKSCDADTSEEENKEEKEKEEEEKYEEEKGEKCTGVDTNAQTGMCKGVNFDLSCVQPSGALPYFTREFEEGEDEAGGGQDYYYYLSFSGLPEEEFGQCSTLSAEESTGNAVVQASKNGHHCFVLGKRASAEWYYNDDVPQHELLVVNYRTSTRFVEIHIFCDEEADEPKYSVRGEEEEWENHYDLELRTKWACKKFAGTKTCGANSGELAGKKKKKKKGGLVFGLIVLFAIVGVGTIYVIQRRRGTSSSNYNNAPDFDLSLLDPDDDMVVFSQGESHNSNRGMDINGHHIDGLLEA